MNDIKEPKVTECWTILQDDGSPMAFVSGCQEEVAFQPAVVLRREGYDAMRKELEELKAWKEEMCT